MSHLSLEDYGLIGNHSSAALVSRLGSIDWCCLPAIDSPCHFGALLDKSLGGRFQLMPMGDFRSEQRYLVRTHILETLFETPFGRATLTDWMPMSVEENFEPVIYRRIDMIRGKISWQLFCAPSFSYGSDAGEAEHHRDAVTFRGTVPGNLARLHASVPLELAPGRNTASARFTLESGGHAQFAWRWGLRPAPRPALGVQGSLPPSPPVAASPRPTLEHWRSCAHRCDPAGCALEGPWHDAVSRSALILKLLIHPELGTLAESVTTSIPGRAREAGRTWDYRFSWLRNSAATLQALANLGYQEECRNFFDWIADTVIRDGVERLQAVYRLDGGKLLPEEELPQLEGYQGARPVRIGNRSSSLAQVDTFGHVMLAASEYHRLFGELPPRLWPCLREIADTVCAAWRRPDHGYWETRDRAEHFVSSKVLCWVALDQAIRLAPALGQEPSGRWVQEREILHHTVCSQGFDRGLGTFISAFGCRRLDSSALLIPLVEFLPVGDPRVRATMDAIQRSLSHGCLIHRCHGGNEGKDVECCHLLSSFWLTQCLALSGRPDLAAERLTELCAYATPLGLFGEQVDPATRETTGNFPSAVSHTALINTALYVGAARGRQPLTGHLLGLESQPRARSA